MSNDGIVEKLDAEDLREKNGPEYWAMLRETAKIVEKWPDWKKGERLEVQNP
jgi:hypothetical protein